MTPQLFFYIIRLLVFSLYSKLDLILISKSKRYIVGFFRSYSLAVGANNLLRVLFFGGRVLLLFNFQATASISLKVC